MDTKRIQVNAGEIVGPLDHYWETVVASSYAHTLLRDSCQFALREAKERLGFSQVRFHGIFTDSIGIYNEDADGNVACNFYLLDHIYDALVDLEMDPFVELSFMPKKLASKENDIFFWNGYSALPNDEEKYQEMIRQFVRHCIERYGLERVRRWNFEVWNEPNLGCFMVGDMQDYFHLYRITVTAIREVDSELKVGGPSTARCAWISEIIDFCHTEKLPLDFITTHLYRQDETFETADWVAGDSVAQSNNVIPDYVQQAKGDNFVNDCFKVSRQLIRESTMPDLPLYFTEYNSYWGRDFSQRDSEYNAAFICQSVFDGREHLDGIAYWTLSDDFEERGVNPMEFGGNFGLVTRKGLFKPVFNAFEMLHRLGDQEVKTESDMPCLAACGKSGKVSVLVWNDTRKEDETNRMKLTIENLPSKMNRVHYRIDRDHSNAYRKWQELGSPSCPRGEDLKTLKSRMCLEEYEPSKEILSGTDTMEIILPSHGVSLIEFVPV